MKIPTQILVDPAESGLIERIDALARAGVYALYSPGRPPYLSWSAHLPRRLKRLLVGPGANSPDRIAQLRSNLLVVECWPTGSRLETSLLLYELSKLHYPNEYLTRLRMRMPWSIGLTDGDAFPRLRVLNRNSRRDGPLFGPFPSRDAAQAYEQQIEGLFQIRRCVDTLTPDPDHPGCIYGEMNQCLRPCQCAVTTEEYAAEAARVADFLSTNGKNSIALLSAARDRACEATEFEQAAQIHKRIEKVREAAAAREAVVSEIHRFSGVALTPASNPRRFRLWPMLEGFWQEPVEMDFSGEESRSKPLDHELRDRLSACLAEPRTTGKRFEELAIFSRWYSSSWRDGEWFPFRRLEDLNYRRLVRQISNLAKSDTAKA